MKKRWHKLIFAIPAALLLWGLPKHSQAQPDVSETAEAPAAPVSGQGVIEGALIDKASGKPVASASVSIVGRKLITVTNQRGGFRFKVPAGTYQLRIYSPDYTMMRVDGVRVAGNETVELAISMLPANPELVLELVVEAEPERKTEAGLISVRRKSATLADGVSAQEFSRSGDGNAGDALKRVVSATIEEGKYVLVRGLGDRYVTTLLNGAVLPSPEPDRQAVPLDLFPTNLLANLMVLKSYSAEYPGSFGGGTVLIETNSFPQEFTLSTKLSLSGDTETTARNRLSYDGGSLDIFGFDDGTRKLPSQVPTNQPVRISDTMAAGQVEAIGESFSNDWTMNAARALPNFSASVTAGDTIAKKSQEFGYLATMGWSSKTTIKDAEVIKLKREGGELMPREQMASLSGNRGAVVGGLAAAAYKPAPKQTISAFALYTHAGDSTAQNVSGLSESDGQLVDSTRLQFVERSLLFTQLHGAHAIASSPLSNTWQINAGITSRDEPNTRDVTYNLFDDGRRRFKDETGSGERFFSTMDETSLGGSTDLAWRFGAGSIKIGASASHAERSFSARRLRYKFVGADPQTLFLPPENIFSDDTIGPEFRLEERTLQPDGYQANLNQLAGFTQGELTLASKLQLAGGVRYETTQQTMDTGTPFALGEPDPKNNLDRTTGHWLPAASMTFTPIENVQLRTAYSHTLARPMFRELAPFLYFDYSRRQSTSGNPALRETRIHNFDLRAEWYLSESELIAIGGFDKEFTDAIEQVVVSASGGDVSFANAPEARAYGLELESRFSLGRIANALSDFRIFGNLTFIRSEVLLAEEQIGSQTSRSRPLQGQSPTVANVGLSYTNSVSKTEVSALYNTYGRRLVEVGFDTLPDTYERAFHRVDVVGTQALSSTTKLKLAATNCLAQKIVFEQGDFAIYRVSPGVGFSIAVEWTPPL